MVATTKIINHCHFIIECFMCTFVYLGWNLLLTLFLAICSTCTFSSFHFIRRNKKMKSSSHSISLSVLMGTLNVPIRTFNIDVPIETHNRPLLCAIPSHL